MSKLIAVVEDDPDILELVSLYLKQSGFRVERFADAGRFFRFLEKTVPDLVLLDIMLPDADGLEVCKSLKKDGRFSSIPIIMLTAKGGETDRILGLEPGADDSIAKPFSPKELVARVKAVLRRQGAGPETRPLRLGGGIVLDAEKHELMAGGKPIPVTSTEFKILWLLASKPGWVFTRDQILDHLWGHEKVVADRTVDVHIRTLRRKLGAAGGLIKNIRGVGYRLEP